VASNPEFLRQGAAIHDFLKPDRIIIGSDSAVAIQYLRNLYRSLDESGQIFIEMDPTSAELTKYCANAYLASRISFMNEMSQIAEHFGADIEMIRRGIGADQRIGTHFLYAGCGFGGSCFPKDVRALRWIAETSNCEAPILRAVEQINERQKEIIFKKIQHYFAGDIKGKVIALWGLSFKPNTDDMREAPSRTLIDALLNAGAFVHAFDPVAAQTAEKIYADQTNFQFHQSRDDVLNNADVLAIVTEWDQFRHPDFKLIKEKLRYPAIFDGRNLYSLQDVAAHGLNYYGIGRGEAVEMNYPSSFVGAE
jgi:UDPglucose 6-dehydrogenase